MRGAIVIPAYNEYARMNSQIEKYLELSKQYDMILVDDGSGDDTYRIGESLGWHVVRLSKNMGKGYAVRAGILRALALTPEPSFIGFSDADLSVSPEQWEKLISKLDEYDIVIGSRSMPDSIVKRSIPRKLISKIFNHLVHEVLQLSVHDTQCGLKFFRPQAARALFSEPLTANRYAFDIEILLRARIMGLSFKETGVNWVARDGSKVGISAPFEMLISLFKIINVYNGIKPLEYIKKLYYRRYFTMLKMIRDFLKDQTGMAEVIGVAFLLIFVVFVLGKPLQNIGTTLSGGYNTLNNKLNTNLNYLNQIN